MKTLVAKDLEISFATEYDLAWGDWGAGSNSDFSAWRPRLSDGFQRLGDYAKSGYGGPETAMLIVKARNQSALAHPVDYKMIWGDWGSGADSDGSFWEPVPPRGYKALGCLVQNNHNKPPLDAVVCVREDLVNKAAVGPRIWGDWGSGADQSVTLYQILPINAAPDGKITYMTPGSFCGHTSYDELVSSSVANAIAVELPTEQKGLLPDKPPTMTSTAKPAESQQTLNSITYIPCTMVKDEAYGTDVKRQVLETPFYTLEKWACYKVYGYKSNAGGSPGTWNYTRTYGASETDSKSITNTVGISMTAGYNGAVTGSGPHFSLTLSYSLALQKSWSETTSQTEADGTAFPIPAHGAAAMFGMSFKYVMKRANGEQMRAWKVDTNDTHFASYPN